MLTVKNISAGPRGLHTTTGLVFLDPGQTRDDLDVEAHELEGAKSTGYFHIAHGSADQPDEGAHSTARRGRGKAAV